jgi:predicted nucleic acid-binding protein
VTGDERKLWTGFADQTGRSPPVGGSTVKKLMSGKKPFLDTNILIYAHIGAADQRAITAQQLIEAGGIIGVQQLNEFVSVARRKLKRSWKEVLTALEDIRILCPDPIPISVGMHDTSLGIAERYGFSIYDSLVIVAALEADCDTLYSEDMQSGQNIEGLTIRNPF